jgi:hypothetical protein
MTTQNELLKELVAVRIKRVLLRKGTQYENNFYNDVGRGRRQLITQDHSCLCVRGRDEQGGYRSLFQLIDFALKSLLVASQLVEIHPPLFQG